MAQTLAQEEAMTLALDVDVIKHSLGRWDEDPSASGLHARRLSLALAEGQLSAGYGVVLGQYLARTQFIEDLAALAQRLDVRSSSSFSTSTRPPWLLASPCARVIRIVRSMWSTTGSSGRMMRAGLWSRSRCFVRFGLARFGWMHEGRLPLLWIFCTPHSNVSQRSYLP
jgi:hypothetical protein